LERSVILPNNELQKSVDLHSRHTAVQLC